MSLFPCIGDILDTIDLIRKASGIILDQHSKSKYLLMSGSHGMVLLTLKMLFSLSFHLTAQYNHVTSSCISLRLIISRSHQ